jgi:predicted metalloprotease
MHDEQTAGHITSGDVVEALGEASAVGDDRICPTCSVEAWTHGSSDQRAAALRAGMGGDRCDLYRFGGPL